MKTTETPLSKCPHCHHRFDRASDVTKDRHSPSPGDFSVCINCGGLGIFNDDLTVRKATRQEEVASLKYPDIMKAQIFIRGRGQLPKRSYQKDQKGVRK